MVQLCVFSFSACFVLFLVLLWSRVCVVPVCVRPHSLFSCFFVCLFSLARRRFLPLMGTSAATRLRAGRPVAGIGAQPWNIAAANIARHYKFSLSYMFDEATDAPGVIVVEDDFYFSPDFYEYFVATAPLLELDPSLWIISAWNDNGFDVNVRGACSFVGRMGGVCVVCVWCVGLAVFPSLLRRVPTCCTLCRRPGS